MDAPGDEEGVGVDEKRVGPLARKRCEGRVDLAAGVGVETWTCSPMARQPLPYPSPWTRKTHYEG